MDLFFSIKADARPLTRVAITFAESAKYPKQLKSLGDHIRKRRLDLGLFQKQAAARIGVDETTIWNWERHESSPRVRDIPAIIRFLGYNPLPVPKSLADKLLSARKALGITQKEMAKRLEIDPTTLARLERGQGRKVFSKTLAKLAVFMPRGS